MKNTLGKYFVVGTALLYLGGCTSTGSSKEEDILSSLSKEQKYRLSAMLENYEDNQKAIDSWKTNEASLIRLSGIEQDLKTLIVQLSLLSQQKQPKPAAPKNVTAKDKTKIPPAQKADAPVAQNNNVTKPQKPDPATADAVSQGAAQRPLTAFGDIEPSAIRTGYAIQLTALNSMDKLREYWTKAQSDYPDILSQQSPIVEPVTNSNGITVLRLKFGDFDDYQQAKETCDALRRNGGSCFIARNNLGEDLF